MEMHAKQIDKVKAWFHSQTKGALTQSEPTFWIIFWVAVAFSAALYYFTYEPIASAVGQQGRLLLSVGYLGIQLWALRNFQLQAFILLGTGLQRKDQRQPVNCTTSLLVDWVK